MAEIQIPLSCVDSSVAGRVQWVHGNLCVTPRAIPFNGNPVTKSVFSLKCPWPFPDNEFDYIHVEGAGFAIPESKVRVYGTLEGYILNFLQI